MQEEKVLSELSAMGLTKAHEEFEEAILATPQSETEIEPEAIVPTSRLMKFDITGRENKKYNPATRTITVEATNVYSAFIVGKSALKGFIVDPKDIVLSKESMKELGINPDLIQEEEIVNE